MLFLNLGFIGSKLIVVAVQTTGVWRRSGERPLELVGWGTSATSLAASRLDSEKVIFQVFTYGCLPHFPSDSVWCGALFGLFCYLRIIRCCIGTQATPKKAAAAASAWSAEWSFRLQIWHHKFYSVLLLQQFYIGNIISGMFLHS